MLVRTMHEVREDMGPLVAMVMCSVPSDEPFTLIVQTSDGTAVGEQMNELGLGLVHICCWFVLSMNCMYASSSMCESR